MTVTYALGAEMLLVLTDVESRHELLGALQKGVEGYGIRSCLWADDIRSGILAVGRMVQQPVVHEGTVAIRRRMRLTMSCDHRVIDGATGARFLQTLKGMLENPLALVY